MQWRSDFVHLAFKHHARYVKVCVKSDKNAYYDMCAVNMQSAFEASDMCEFHRLCRSILPKGSSNYPLYQYKGLVAQDPKEARTFVMQHFRSCEWLYN